MNFTQVFNSKAIVFDMESDDKDEAFEELVQKLIELYPRVSRTQVLDGLLAREAQMSTGIMHGIAVPHTDCDGIDNTVGVIGLSFKGIDYESLDGSAVNLIFMLLSPKGHTEEHLQALGMLATVLQSKDFLKELMEQKSVSDFYNKICDFCSEPKQ